MTTMTFLLKPIWLATLSVFLLASCAEPGDTHRVEPRSAPPTALDTSAVAPDSSAAALDSTAAPLGTSAACDDAHSLWDLNTKGRWARRCLDAALTRDTAAWTVEGTGLVGLGPQGCTAVSEPLVAHSVRGAQVEDAETDLNSYFVTKGTGVVVDDKGSVHTYGGEWCIDYNSGLHTVLFADGTSKHEVFNNELVWPVVLAREEKVLVSGGLALRQGELDVSTDPGLEFKPNPFCWFIHPDAPQDFNIPRFCGRKRGEYVPEAAKKGTWFSRADVDGAPILPPGRELTFVYDRKRDRLVSVAFFEPNMWKSSEMDPTPLLWKVDRRAWSIPKEGKATQLPAPPIVGDGVTLLYDPVAEQVLLFDPFGTQSWVLASDDSAWQVWKTHESLPLPQGVELPENTRGTEHRFTQWWAPYFAYWDLERGAPTVVFYDSPHSLCLPVEGLEDTYACPKAHS